uniref:Sugar transporter SWEET n=1 Tax=Arion vulgaris TaxID=1028688 RepID=A0A0B7BES1_9EUPU
MVMDFLPDLITIVEWATLILAFVMMASGLPICLNMYRNKSTANVPYLLFLVVEFVCNLGLQYAIAVGNTTLIILNAVSAIVWGTYIGVYILVSKSKSKPLAMLFSVVGLFCAHIYYLTTVPSNEYLPTIGKYMMVWCTSIGIIPAGEIYTIIQEKSTNCCNMSMMIGGTLNASVMCFYGYLMNDIYISLPTVPGLLVNFIKIILIFRYGLPSGQSDINQISKDADDKVHNGKTGETLRRRK